MAIICQRNLRFKLLDTWADSKGRITVAKVHIENRDVALVSIYAPNTFEKEFYEQITKVLLELSGFKFIIGPDFNAVVDYSADRLGNSENLDYKNMLLRLYVPGSMMPGWWIFGIHEILMLKATPIYHLDTNLSLVLTLFFLLEACFIILLMLAYFPWRFPTISQ